MNKQALSFPASSTLGPGSKNECFKAPKKRKKKKQSSFSNSEQGLWGLQFVRQPFWLFSIDPITHSWWINLEARKLFNSFMLHHSTTAASLGAPVLGCTRLVTPKYPFCWFSSGFTIARSGPFLLLVSCIFLLCNSNLWTHYRALVNYGLTCSLEENVYKLYDKTLHLIMSYMWCWYGYFN